MREFIYVVLFFIISCTSKYDNYLNKGLYELQNKRTINKTLIDGFIIKTLGIIKSQKKEDTYDLVFLLNEDVSKEIVENYSVTIRVVPTDEEKEKNNITKPELLWDFKPNFVDKNGHKYMVKTVTTKLKKIKNIRIALYHRLGYQGVTLSRVVFLKNITLY